MMNHIKGALGIPIESEECEVGIRQVAEDSGFEAAVLSQVSLREEYEVPVPSLVVTFEKRR